MDRRERSGNPDTAMLAFADGLQANIWTALPAIVQSYDNTKKTVVLQVALQFEISRADGTAESVEMPPLVDCPVQFPGGGGATLTFPLAEGDEGLVVFASRCIDAWWQSGGVQRQAEFRMHDLSDGFFIPGVSSVPNVPAGLSTTHVELRSKDGQAKVRLNPVDHSISVFSSNGSITIEAAASSVSIFAGGDAVVSAQGDVSIDATGSLRLQGRFVNKFGGNI